MSEASERQVLITTARHKTNEPVYHTGECTHVRRRGRDGYREVPMGALNDSFRECGQCERLVNRFVNGCTCPNCGSEPSSVSWQTAPNQLVCGNDDCPVNSWNPDGGDLDA